MAQYNKKPHWVELDYYVSNLQHKMSFPVSVVDDTIGNTTYNLVQGGGLPNLDFSTFITGMLTEFERLLDLDNSTIGETRLYRQLATDNTPRILTTLDTSQTVIGIGTSQLGTQATMVFRDTEGYIIKLVVNEGLANGLQRVVKQDAPDPYRDFMSYMHGTTKAVHSVRGNPIDTPKILSVSYNDSITRKRYGVS